MEETQGRRWVFTINNPFGIDIDEIDISKTNLVMKTDYYDKSSMETLRESGLFNFKYVKIEHKLDDFETEEFVVERPFFKDNDSLFSYLESLEHRKYFIYSIERGEKEKTEHIQGVIFFNIGKRFSTIKRYLPFVHIEKAKGSNSQARDYCMKSETHVSGPYEFGEFAEERERTDYRDFLQLVHSGASNRKLARLYPSLFIRERNKLEKLREDIHEEYSEKCRSVDVTYIYGSSGAGKTTHVQRELGFKNVFYVTNYDNSMFTNCNFADTIVMDEFTGSFNIQKFNRMVDGTPFQMRGLGESSWACFHHIYIVSNYSPKELYKDVQRDNYKVYRAFDRRLHKIIRIDSNHNIHIERDTEWEDCTDEVDLQLGKTKQIKCTYEYNEYGDKIYLYDRYKDISLQEISAEGPFKEEDRQAVLDSNGNLKF